MPCTPEGYYTACLFVCLFLSAQRHLRVAHYLLSIYLARVYPAVLRPVLGMLTLGAKRAAHYGYTRPIFGAAAIGLGYSVSTHAPPLTPPPCSGAVDALSLLPLAAAGLVGAASAWRGRIGYSWLAHRYERVCWCVAFGGLTVAAGVEGAAAVARSPKPAAGSAAGPTSRREQPPLLLGLSAACVLAATAGERLGSGLGRVLVPSLGALGLVSAVAVLALGDSRGELALRGVAAALVPALHLCLPVYSLSADGALASLWWLAALAVAASEVEPPGLERPGDVVSAAALQHMLLALGALSLHRTLLRRVPVCRY